MTYESLKAYCLRNEIKAGDWLWSSAWGRGYRAAKKVTGWGESCVVMRRHGAMEHLEHDAPLDVRRATAEEIAAEKTK